jgi:hypothetical protein
VPSDEWERGFAAGWRARRDNLLPEDEAMEQKKTKVKKERKASKYNKEYAKQYAKLKKKHPRTSFAGLAKKAHKATKKVMK